MLRWYEMSPDLLTPAGPAHKPVLVTRYAVHWYWKTPTGPTYGAFFRWYWQANIVSFLWHHVGRQSCNTWLRKPRPE